MKKRLGQHFKTFFNSYSEIFFLQSPVAGVLLFLVTLTNLNVGIAGIVSVLAAYLFARLIGMSDAFLSSGFFTYNALLVGLSIGYLFALGPLSLFFVVTAGIFTFVLSVMTNSIFSYYLKLPILSLPFVIVSSIAYLASYGYSNLYVTGLYAHGETISPSLPFWLEGFFISLGAILFSPNTLAGMLFAVVILLASRILFFLAVLGFYLGATISGLMEGAMTSAFLQINNFNFILIAMALGGVYLVPAPKSYLIAAIAVAVATILLDAIHLFWANYGIPAFTLPFNFVTMTFLYVLGLVGFPLVAQTVRRTPEETLDEYISNVRRFRGSFRKLTLPFSGKWTVWQGFDGAWTHQGSWKYAYDFVIEKAGKTCKNDGKFLEEYYAFKKPVFSPCKGRIVSVVSNQPDNLPGMVDKTDNWGNLVIIETTLDYFVELSHFAQNSIRVQEGQWVEVGTQLGLCGNSGYSPQPHIHVQIQATAQIGAVTLPFSFHGYLENSRFVANDLPPEKAIIEPLHPNRDLEFQTAFILEQRFTFQALQGERLVQTVTLSVCMAAGGETYFDSGKAKLFFAKDAHSFYFYRLEGDDPWLSLLFAALPRMPLVYRRGMTWEDMPPVSAVAFGWRKHLLNLARAFYHRLCQTHYSGHWEGNGVIAGTLTQSGGQALPVALVLDRNLGFSRIRVGERCLERKEEENL
ncbi:peptidase M23 [Candidatus Thiomargarita nelsonii]|uniref:Peptidase M23 n=1 Tax=Candidatus Thiomargarita nelsonii TaxID=1003181 RepID=A0A0A6P6M6_9GAMM|nr:peptidase M23 [Candidatus Thiomargarita nelsonii]